MSKIKIKFIYLLSIFIITGCSYEPIFSKKNYNIKLDNLSFAGEKDVNRIIENQLNLFKSVENDNQKFKPKANNSAKIYSIDILSQLNKVIISKDSKGDPEKFEETLTVFYKVIQNNRKILDKKIEEKYVYNNDKDKFKLEEREKIIKENLAQNASNIIISSIINSDDS